MSEELYENPRPESSQGDILDLVPHIYLQKPLLSLAREAETIFRASTEPFPQFDDKNGQSIAATCKRQRAILVSHDCEIDKPQVRRWLVCPVIPLVALPTENRDLVRRNRIYAMLHLPKYRDGLPESFVDFNQVTTLGADFIESAKRLVSLSDMGRMGLYAQFIRWLTRWQLREIECPNCGVVIDPTARLPLRSA